ncbi:MAG: hypothetical protein VW999_12540 [Alphaproteobacteria bacterium]
MEIDERLIVQFEFTVPERIGQGMVQSEFPIETITKRWTKKFNPIAAALSCFTQGKIGRMNQFAK